MLKLTNNSSPFYNRSYFLLRRVKLGFPFLENKPMTILQIMKLLHHSQGYSQYTFIQKYRISHISHSGLNRHWSIMWAFKGPGLEGDTCEDPPSVTTNSQSGGGRGREGGRDGGGGRRRQRGTQVLWDAGSLWAAASVRPSAACWSVLLQHSQTICTWKTPTSYMLSTAAVEGAPAPPAASVQTGAIFWGRPLALTMLWLGGVQTQPSGYSLARPVFMHTIM